MKSCKYGIEDIINSSPILYILGYGVFFLAICCRNYDYQACYAVSMVNVLYYKNYFIEYN